MKEYYVLITRTEERVNKYLKDGWSIDSVTPQCVSTGGGSHLEGTFCFVLSRLKE